MVTDHAAGRPSLRRPTSANRSTQSCTRRGIAAQSTTEQTALLSSRMSAFWRPRVEQPPALESHVGFPTYSRSGQREELFRALESHVGFPTPSRSVNARSCSALSNRMSDFRHPRAPSTRGVALRSRIVCRKSDMLAPVATIPACRPSVDNRCLLRARARLRGAGAQTSPRLTRAIHSLIRGWSGSRARARSSSARALSRSLAAA
jgi:hypothetical protein